MTPTIGRIVHYKLGQSDIDAINSYGINTNSVKEGDVLPAMIVNAWGNTNESGACKLQVFLDGRGTLLSTSRCGNAGQNEDGFVHQPYTWIWPPRV